VSPVKYAGGKRSLRAYIAVCLQIHCNPSRSGMLLLRSVLVVQVKSVGQVLFNDVIRKLGVLESDYFDLEYTDIHGVHVSSSVHCTVVSVYTTQYFVHNTSVCLRVVLITKSCRTASKRACILSNAQM